MDGRDEEQEGQHGTVSEKGLGLEGLRVLLFQQRADGFFSSQAAYLAVPEIGVTSGWSLGVWIVIL